MSRKLHIKKGDNVMVISGDSKGEQGRVLMVDIRKSKAIVEGINMVAKHSKPNTENPQGGIIHKESPIHISNLMVVNPAGEATRIGRRMNPKSNKSSRYSIKSGEDIK